MQPHTASPRYAHHPDRSQLSEMPTTLRPATLADASQIAAIYNPYILETVISFEEAAVSSDEMALRIADTLQTGLPWLVAEQNGQILGYAYASKWKGRCAYRYAVESSVYLAKAARGQGLGSTLYRALLAQLRIDGRHTVIGGVALPNAASVALHEKLGFKSVALFKEVGYKFGQWIDVGYWQLHLKPEN
jgi:L-amino acid N-acyltransferase YncA